MSQSHEDLDKNLIEGHEYDGIRELDNPLPGWWLVTFYGAIIFSFFYWMHFHSGGSGLPTSEELAKDLAAIEAQRAASAAAAPAPEGEDLSGLVSNPAALAAGKDVYVGKCAACHGAGGEGTIGPNLTDNFWIHGKGKIEDVIVVVSKGVLEKGMPAWETMLKPDEVHQVAAYVVSLKGTNPPNPKKPDGVEITE